MSERDFMSGLGELMRQQSILTQKISCIIPGLLSDTPYNQERPNQDPILAPARSFGIPSIVHTQNVMHERQVLDALRNNSDTLHRTPASQQSDFDSDVPMCDFTTQTPTFTAPVQRMKDLPNVSNAQHFIASTLQPHQAHSSFPPRTPAKPAIAVQKKKRTRIKSQRVSLSVPLHDEDSYILKEPGLSRTLGVKATIKQVRTRLPYIKIQRGASTTRWRVDMHISQSRNAALRETKRLMKTTESIAEAVQWRDEQLAKWNLRVGVCNGNWTIMPLQT